MNYRENVLRAIRFEKPDYIPMAFRINGACWHHYDQNALQDLMDALDNIAATMNAMEKYAAHYS